MYRLDEPPVERKEVSCKVVSLESLLANFSLNRPGDFVGDLLKRDTRGVVLASRVPGG